MKKEVYSIGDESTSFDYVKDPVKNAELEKTIERKVQFREVIECLDTSIGALVKVKCMEDQDKKLKKFSKASDALALQIERVGKIDTRSPRETE